jgi:pimeloyl-ACP methyl ester carboxylesterase
MVIEDFDGSFDDRMRKLESLLAGKTDIILVGSSYGGLMAAVYACRNEERVRKLVLLAPALHIDSLQPCLTKVLQIPVVVFHGLRDEVVPMAAVREVAERIFATCEFNTVDDDHVLHNTFAGLDWDTLLGS